MIDLPLIFRPCPVARPWGGRRATDYFGWQPPAGEPTGEWWLLSSRPECPTVVESGAFEGLSLSDLLNDHGEDLTGRVVSGPLDFPFLVKILDASTTLSVQLHPSDAQRPGEGKSEAWLVLDAGPKAELLVGLIDGCEIDAFFDAAESGLNIGDMLRRYPATPGSLIEVPPGRIHALGADVLALEVQQNSDTTYRIFDWNREPKRRLHLEQARIVASPCQRVEHLQLDETRPNSTIGPLKLLENEHFRMDQILLPAETELSLSGFGILVPLTDEVTALAKSVEYRIPRAFAALLSPTTTIKIRANKPAHLIWITGPY